MVLQRDKGKRAFRYLKVLAVIFLFVLTAGNLSCTSSTGSTSSSGSNNGGGSGTGWTVSVILSQSTIPQSVGGDNPTTLSTTPVTIRVVDSSNHPPANGQVVYLTCSNGAFGFQGTDYSKPITSTSALLTQGQAQVTFTAGFTAPTTAAINASYLGAVGSATIEITANPNP
jgi:hypothetical protein